LERTRAVEETKLRKVSSVAMASRIFLALLVVACAALSVAARTGPGFESDTGRALLQHGGGSHGGQQFNPYNYQFGYQPHQQFNPYQQYNPYEQYNPYGPYLPQQQQNYTAQPDPYVPFKPTFGGYPGSGGMCPDGYMVTYASSGIECMLIPQPEPKKSKYPPRDYLSIQRCPVGELYRYMANGRTACLPESYVYEGTYAAGPAAPPPDDK